MTITRAGKTCALAAVTAVLGACGNSTSPPSAPAGPPPIGYTHVWSAQPGVDLFSRGAELVRATFESAHYAEITNDVHKAYPGYGDAFGAPHNMNTNPDGDDGRISDWWLHGPTDTPGHATTVTDHAYITDYSATATDIKAVVCDYAIAPDPTVEHPDQIDGAYVLELHNPTSDPGRTGIAQPTPGSRDPRATLPPTWNVFGPWQITHLGTPVRNPPDPQPCIGWWKSHLPGWDGDYGRLYPQAGTTTPHESLQPQYPQWIRPA